MCVCVLYCVCLNVSVYILCLCRCVNDCLYSFGKKLFLCVCVCVCIVMSDMGVFRPCAYVNFTVFSPERVRQIKVLSQAQKWVTAV